MKFHEKIVNLRKKQQWSQQDLCDKVGVHIAHLSRLENGKSSPSALLLNRISHAFGVTMDYLMDEDADEVTPVSIKNKSLANRLELLEQLEPEDQQTLINVIDSMLTKKKMLDLLTKKEKGITS